MSEKAALKVLKNGRWVAVPVLLSPTSGSGGGLPGEDGGYYMPTVSDGILSWQPSKEDMPSAPSADVRGQPGEKGDPGKDGEPGKDGSPGVDGFSPTVSVTDTDGGHLVTITDKTGAKTFEVKDGVGGSGEIPNSNIVNGETTGSLQGIKCRAYYGNWAVALGCETEASNFGAFAAGHGAEAKGWGSVALGSNTIAEGYNAFAVGTVTKAYGDGSFAQGQYTDAYGYFSHVEGEYTIARGQAQHVQGKYNIEDNNDRYAHIVGNGYYDDDMEEYCRSNAHTLDWKGNAWYQGAVECAGIILTSPNGTKYKMTIEDGGSLSFQEWEDIVELPVEPPVDES